MAEGKKRSTSFFFPENNLKINLPKRSQSFRSCLKKELTPDFESRPNSRRNSGSRAVMFSDEIGQDLVVINKFDARDPLCIPVEPESQKTEEHEVIGKQRDGSEFPFSNPRVTKSQSFNCSTLSRPRVQRICKPPPNSPGILSPSMSPALRRSDKVPNITLSIHQDDALSDIEDNLDEEDQETSVDTVQLEAAEDTPPVVQHCEKETAPLVLYNGADTVPYCSEDILSSVPNCLEDTALSVPHCLEDTASNVPHCLEDTASNVPHCSRDITSSVPHRLKDIASSVPYCSEDTTSSVPHCLEDTASSVPHCLEDTASSVPHCSEGTTSSGQHCLEDTASSVPHCLADTANITQHCLEDTASSVPYCLEDTASISQYCLEDSFGISKCIEEEPRQLITHGLQMIEDLTESILQESVQEARRIHSKNRETELMLENYIRRNMKERKTSRDHTEITFRIPKPPRCKVLGTGLPPPPTLPPPPLPSL